MLHGEKEIKNAKIKTIKNKYPNRDYWISITLPEFTCKCPISGYPDFATIKIFYIPDKKIVELKSLKLYINSYRDKYVFHEEVSNKILDDFLKIVKPRKVILIADFNPRGNVHTVITLRYP